jgi:hypothetical protein
MRTGKTSEIHALRSEISTSNHSASAICYTLLDVKQRILAIIYVINIHFTNKKDMVEDI